jgi:hypothetical protein
LAVLIGLGAWRIFGRQDQAPTPPSSSGNDARNPVVATKPLTIRLHVFRLSQDGKNYQPYELGEDKGAYRVRLKEKVELKADLSDPAYAYMLAFNPTKKPEDLVEFVPKSEENQPPEKKVHWDPKTWLTLDDGEGLQAFAVVASRQPLPAYSQWRQRQPACPWAWAPAKSGVVLRSVGQLPLDEAFGVGVARTKQEPAGDIAAIEALVRWLKGLESVEAITVMSFAVDAPE